MRYGIAMTISQVFNYLQTQGSFLMLYRFRF